LPAGPAADLGALKWVTRGVAITEQLEATDCRMTPQVQTTPADTFPGDHLLIALAPDRSINATLTSSAFPPRLELYQHSDANGALTRVNPPLVASNTGAAGTANLTYTVPGTGSNARLYRLVVMSADTALRGAYTLTIAGPLPNEAGAQLLGPGSVSRGVRRGRKD
jgi:hypothetical protein